MACWKLSQFIDDFTTYKAPFIVGFPIFSHNFHMISQGYPSQRSQVDLLQEEEILQLEALLKKMNPKVGLGWVNGLGKQDWASGEK